MDISLCPGIGCPKKESCRRYTTPAGGVWQAWTTPQYDPESGLCPIYYPNLPTETRTPRESVSHSPPQGG